MKLYKQKIIALILAIALIFTISGCGVVQNGVDFAKSLLPEASASAQITQSSPAPTADVELVEGLVPFEDMVYARPDAEAISQRFLEIKDEALAQENIDDVIVLLEEFEALFDTYYSMTTLAAVHSAANKSDEYWLAEDEYNTNGSVSISEAGQALIRALFESPFKAGIEEWDEEYFTGMPEQDSVTPKTKPMFEREAELIMQYTNMLTLESVEHNGKSYTLSDISAIDDYNEYFAVYEKWTKELNPKLAGIYVEIVKLRTQIAKELGYDGFTEWYYSEYRGGYDEAMLRDIVDEIKQYIIPAYVRTAQTGLYFYPEVNMDYAEFNGVARDMLNELSPSFLESIDVMNEYNLCGHEPGAYKESGAATYYISNYKAPYILMNYTGDTNSIQTFLHEFGHFYDDHATEYANGTQMDIAEIYSQAMELLCADLYPEYFGEQTGNEMRHDALAAIFSTFAQQPLYTAIELRAYELGEDITVDALNEIAREEYADFGMSGYMEAVDYAHLSWVENPQIVTSAYHTISYVTSAAVALQIWEQAQTDRQQALDTYEEMIQSGAKYTFLETVERAGLVSPFKEGEMQHLAQMLEEYLYLE